MSKKIVFVSSLAAPHQIKLCKELNQFMDIQFWFYEHINRSKASWWKIPLISKTIILEKSLFKEKGKYLNFKLIKKLNDYDPDILFLGGFTIPSNYLAYRWAKKKCKKVAVFSELSRNSRGVLRKKWPTWIIIKYLYKKVDFIFAVNDDAKKQFQNFGFDEKVIKLRYSTDLSAHLSHEIRIKKENHVFLFANRLVEIYNPLFALDIFKSINKVYPSSKLLMNNIGPLKNECVRKINELKLTSQVQFLDSIQSWDELPNAYAKSDFLLFPAKFSNGNMSINESMASGLGIIISNKIKGHSDILKNNENCFILDLDKDQFFEAVNKYILNYDLFKKHTILNKKLISPLSAKGTAKFYFHTFKKIGLFE